MRYTEYQQPVSQPVQHGKYGHRIMTGTPGFSRARDTDGNLGMWGSGESQLLLNPLSKALSVLNRPLHVHPLAPITHVLGDLDWSPSSVESVTVDHCLVIRILRHLMRVSSCAFQFRRCVMLTIIRRRK